MPVCRLRTANVGYSNDRELPHWKVGAVSDLRDGAPGTDLDERIYDKDYDVIVRKTGPSIFFGTPGHTFHAEGRCQIADRNWLCHIGLYPRDYNRQFSYGFRTMVPEDCVGDHSSATPSRTWKMSAGAMQTSSMQMPAFHTLRTGVAKPMSVCG